MLLLYDKTKTTYGLYLLRGLNNMDMSKLLNTGSAETVKIKKFKKQSKGVNKKEKRRLEVLLLKPARLKRYTGKNVKRVKFSKTSVKISFSSEENLALFKKYFVVWDFVESNVTDISLLMALLHKLESGRLVYEEGKLLCNIKGSCNKGVSKLDKKKQRFRRKRNKLRKS